MPTRRTGAVRARSRAAPFVCVRTAARARRPAPPCPLAARDSAAGASAPPPSTRRSRPARRASGRTQCVPGGSGLTGSSNGGVVVSSGSSCRRSASERGGVEAGADLARVAQGSGLVVADQQRADPDARAARLGEAADDDLLLEHALELEPVARAAAAVGRVRALGDQTLPAGPARALIGRQARPRDRGAHLQRRAGPQRRHERGVPVALRPVAQVRPVEPEQVERPQRRGAVALQRLEPQRLAVVGHRDDLPVDDRVAERLERFRDGRVHERALVARAQRDRALVHEGETAHTVELAFEHPVVAQLTLVAERGEHGIDPLGLRYRSHSKMRRGAPSVTKKSRSSCAVASAMSGGVVGFRSRIVCLSWWSLKGATPRRRARGSRCGEISEVEDEQAGAARSTGQPTSPTTPPPRRSARRRARAAGRAAAGARSRQGRLPRRVPSRGGRVPGDPARSPTRPARRDACFGVGDILAPMPRAARAAARPRAGLASLRS